MPLLPSPVIFVPCVHKLQHDMCMLADHESTRRYKKNTEGCEKSHSKQVVPQHLFGSSGLARVHSRLLIKII